MPLFSLTDITFGNAVRTGSAASDLSGSGYNYSILRYPSDLGNYDKGHYILLHINQQKLTQFETLTTGDQTSAEALTAARNALGTGSTSIGQSLSTIGNATVDVGAMLSDKITSGLNNLVGADVVNKSKELLGDILPSSSSDNGFMKFVGGAANELGSLGSQIMSGQGLRTTKRTIDTVALRSEEHTSELQSH